MSNLHPAQGDGKFMSKLKDNKLVVFGLLSTTAILCSGLATMVTDNQRLGNKLMRARILAQGATVLSVVFGMQQMAYSGKQPVKAAPAKPIVAAIPDPNRPPATD
eukprot:GILK01004902.1.p2 GENE.GILK01004902.1~~GILK01004902.1.p2  ORF type:complete len:105 (+),score=16.57 GILK01004902.1:82-396(+)